jgi:protein tyrosine/serine phosphatase
MGKDRTGVIVALLLSLGGVSHETIAAEFTLTEAHLEHLQPKIADIVRSIDPTEKDPLEIAKMATECRSVLIVFWLKYRKQKKRKLMVRYRSDVMLLTLKYIDERYGGISQYAQDYCEFSAQDIDRIKKNLLCQ